MRQRQNPKGAKKPKSYKLDPDTIELLQYLVDSGEVESKAVAIETALNSYYGEHYED